MDLLAEQLRETTEWSKKMDRVIRDCQADGLWRDTYPKLSRDRDGFVGTVCARAEAQVTRLATIYALLDKSAVISLSHLQAALAVWRYCEESAALIYRDVSQEESVANTIYCALRRHIEGLDRTQLHALFGRNRHAAEIADAVLQLTLADRVRCTRIPSIAGRPTEVIVAVS